MNALSWAVVLLLFVGGLWFCTWLFNKSPGLLIAGIAILFFAGGLFY